MTRLLFIVLILSLSPLYAVKAQQKISFKQVYINYATKSYYISDVVDDRPDKGNDGVVKDGGQTTKMTFAGGLAASLKAYIAKYVSQNKAGQPIVLHITSMDAVIKKEGGLWSANASRTFTYYAAGKSLEDYQGSVKATMDDAPGDFMEEFLRLSLTNDLKKFDEWWPKNKDKIVVNNDVKVNVTISKTTQMPHCIAYSLQRPLQVVDFMGPADNNTDNAAETVSGIGMGYGGSIVNGQFVINVTITPYFDLSRSWCKESGKNAYVLGHEQAHFDITAIKACQLANAIRETTFTRDNYISIMDKLQLQYTQAAKDEESLYDKETNHSIIHDQQILWQNKIAAQVKGIGCY